MRELFSIADGIATRVRGAKTQQSGKTYSRASGAALDNTDTLTRALLKDHRNRSLPLKLPRMHDGLVVRGRADGIALVAAAEGDAAE